MTTEPPHLLARLAALSDLARLRILRLLASEELSVGELARALQLPQSTVSRHLKLLHEGGWVMKRSEGTASLYALVEAGLDADARSLWAVARAQIGTSPTLTEDDTRLREVLAERRSDSRTFFGRIGGDWDNLRQELFGGQSTVEALLELIPPEWTIVDLGCGTGNAAEHLAPIVRRVIAVDREPAMIEAAQKRLRGCANVEFVRAEGDALPIDDASVDAVMVFLVFHHLEDPLVTVREIARILRKGGVFLMVDMVAHDRESYRHTMGHRHLGFDEPTVASWAKAAGLSRPRYRRLRPATAARGPGLFAATMRRE